MKRSAAPEVEVREDFDWDEVVPLLIRARGIKSGLWSFGMRFGFSALNAGEHAQDVSPAGIVAARGLSLLRTNSPGPLVYDASNGCVRVTNDVPPAPAPAVAVRGSGTDDRAAGKRRKKTL